MINKEIREQLSGYDDAIVFDNPSFDYSIIGIDDTGRVVYSYEKMVEELMEDDGISYEDAVDFIDYNTLRALAGIPNAPIVMYDLLGLL